MIYLFDTDTIIYWLKGNPKIESKAVSVGLENISHSIISQAELYFGAYNSEYADKNILSIHKVAETLALIPFDESSAKKFGEIKANLKKSGKIILDADIMIASIAITQDLTLVTNNIKHYKRISELKIENWVE